MELTHTYSDAQLQRILEQSLVYTCACPAQVAKQINQLRGLFAYQAQCLNLTDTDHAVHANIAAATVQAHTTMENCLTDILKLEGWDIATMTMPDDLVKRITGEISGTPTSASGPR